MSLFKRIKSKSKEGLVTLLATAAVSCGGGSSGDGGGGGVYIPDVNSPPLLELEYFKPNKDVGGGHVLFKNRQDEIYDIQIDISDNGIETNLYEGNVGSGNNRKGLIYIIDKYGEYLPHQRLISPRQNATNQPSASGSDLFLLTPVELGHSLGSIAIDLFDLPTPEWHQENKDSPDGSIYLGDWSFHDLQNLNTSLKNASCHIMESKPDHVTVWACGAFSFSGSVLSGIEDLSDLLEDLGYGPLDLDTKYPRYLFSSEAPYFMTIGTPHDAHSKVAIKDLYPLQLGTRWTFNNGEAVVRVEDTFTSLGTGEMAVLRTGNVRELVGYKTTGNNDELRYFGFKDSELGDVILSPPIVLGDKNINIGRKFINESSLSISNHPDFSGRVETTYDYFDRSQIILSNDTPYGDCIGQKETTYVYIHNNSTGETFEDTIETQRYLAKNVGPVLIDGYYELTNMSITDNNNNISYDGTTDNELYPVGGSIIDSIKRGVRETK